jgi:hypothetical protein
VVRKYEQDGNRVVDIELDFQRDGTVLGSAWATFALR